MADLPTGTVTFLFTDIEGSTALWERDPTGMGTAAAADTHTGLRVRLNRQYAASVGLLDRCGRSTVHLENIALVPTSLLPLKAGWQTLANSLPQGTRGCEIPPR